MPKLVKISPDWHAEAISAIRDNFAGIHKAFFDAARKAVWLGLYLNAVKERGKADKSIPHGQFIPWLEKNLPDLGLSQVKVYMTIGRGVAEKAKIQKAGNRLFATMVNPGDLPAAVEKLIEGKNQQALFLEFKQAEEIEDGLLKSKKGRRKGEGGNSAEHLAAVKAAEEKARIIELELAAKDFGKWLDQNCDAEGLGKIGDSAFAKFCDHLESAWGFCRQLKAARKNGGAE